MDIMLDIETLGLDQSAAILSIGAVKFDITKPGEIIDTFHRFVDPNSNAKYGRTVTIDTVMWWLKQDRDALSRLNKGLESAQLLPVVLTALQEFVLGAEKVWGNGAAFDNAIIRHAFNFCDLNEPWSYRADACYRTAKKMFPMVEKPPFEGVKHDALDDAINQAHHLQLIYKYVNNVQQA